ncbi:MAG TPA: twin-arginine translocase TatA/TatE family subunit [Gemmatimonadaceae bacterium]
MELFIILVIVLVLFGARRVPEIGASLGKGIREFKRSINDVQRQVSETDDDRHAERLRPAEPAARTRQEEEPAREPKRLM